MAADLGVRPVYKTPVMVVSSWTGFYAGLNTGGSIGVSSTTNSMVVTGPGFAGFPVGPTTLFADSFRHAPTGWIFGGQIGYNYQVSNWVFGLEADWQWTSQKDTATGGACNSSAILAVIFLLAPTGSQCLTDEQKLTNFGTARARGGVVVNDSLWYVTGGAAWATVKSSYALAASCVLCGPAFQPGPFLSGAAAFSQTKTGWTLGGGVETKLGGGWSVKLEYLYVDLGTVSNAFGVAITPVFTTVAAPFLNGAAATVATSSHVTDHIVRVGVNYKIF